MIKKLKKIKLIRAPIHYVHQKAIDCALFFRYLRADDIHWVWNNRGSDKKYLIFRYVGTQGLMAQVMGVLAWINYAEINHYTLIVDMTRSNEIYREAENENVWEKFFEQPMLDHAASHEWIKEVEHTENYAFCPLIDRASLLWNPDYINFGKHLKPTINHPTTRDYKDSPEIQKRYEYLFKSFIRPVKNVQQYIDDEYRQVMEKYMKNNKILGVIVRGTDYTGTKPYMHPVQPTIEMVMEKVKALKELNEWDYIYLATDEKAVEEEFNKEFPGKIITNYRFYYESSNYQTQPLRNIHHDRERDHYLRGVEYYSSMNLLSKCDRIVGGLCGGSQAAMLMNHGKYKEICLFDLGNYS